MFKAVHVAKCKEDDESKHHESQRPHLFQLLILFPDTGSPPFSLGREG